MTGLGEDEENWIYLEYLWQSQWYSDGLGIVGEAKQIQEKNFKFWTWENWWQVDHSPRQKSWGDAGFGGKNENSPRVRSVLSCQLSFLI